MNGVSTANSLPAPGEPCGRCGVRADVACKHRPASGAQPPAIASPDEEDTDGRRRPGNGNNFRRPPSE